MFVFLFVDKRGCKYSWYAISRVLNFLLFTCGQYHAIDLPRIQPPPHVVRKAWQVRKEAEECYRHAYA
jgi:hypothetical protein